MEHNLHGEFRALFCYYLLFNASLMLFAVLVAGTPKSKVSYTGRSLTDEE